MIVVGSSHAMLTRDAVLDLATQLNGVFTAAVRRTLSDEPATVDPRTVDPRRYGAAGRDAIAPEATWLLRLLGTGNASREEHAGLREPAVGSSKPGLFRRTGRRHW
jgi:hypothetical protein